MLPTKKNIEESIAWLIEDAKTGDTYVDNNNILFVFLKFIIISLV